MYSNVSLAQSVIGILSSVLLATLCVDMPGHLGIHRLLFDVCPLEREMELSLQLSILRSTAAAIPVFITGCPVITKWGD